MSTTLVLGAKEIASLRDALAEAAFEFRALDHAHWQARGEEVVVSAYRSGKVVVQGKGEGRFLERYRGGAGGRSEAERPPDNRGAGGRSEAERPPDNRRAGAGASETQVGSDESGKGDYFGPLVVAAVVVTPETAPLLAQAGVRDCKTMGDGAVHKAALVIRKLCPHAVRSLSPAEYNARHEADGNVAIFLAAMHAQAIAAALEGVKGCRRVVIDQFTRPERLRAELKKAGVTIPAEIRTKAEDNPAVAAASVLARAEFLNGLRELGHGFGTELPKGAGEPVDRVAREIYALGGLAALSGIAKTHFKTTGKAVSARR